MVLGLPEIGARHLTDKANSGFYTPSSTLLFCSLGQITTEVLISFVSYVEHRLGASRWRGKVGLTGV